MAPSQLKQLKASLRENGVLGPLKSKKQRKNNARDGQKRLQRNVALESIRERFNPFEAKGPARKEKFSIASNKPTKVIIERPGVTRGLGEERRRETLLKEMQSRNKVGGMMDRRFGENDPTMTPEEKSAERFARQAMKASKKSSMFNLEDDSEEDLQLTHGGRALDFDNVPRDDYAEEDSLDSEAEDFDQQDDRPRKRQRIGEDFIADNEQQEEEMIQRKKSKNEVMQEVIAKSKMYKAARQAAKADDDELRIELDKGMGDFYDALRGHKVPEKQLPSPPGTDSEPLIDPSRAAMLAGKSREEAEKEYEANLRQLKLDARSKPTTRTKTEEEKATEEKERLEQLERERIRRMKGEPESSDEGENEDEKEQGEELEETDDAELFGLAQPAAPYRPQLDVEDEDDFVLDDIVASDSNAELDSEDESHGSDQEIEVEDDGDDDFINGLVLPKIQAAPIDENTRLNKPATKSLAFTYPCPQSHEELLTVVKDTQVKDLPTVVQRIRALYHKGLAEGNQQKLAKFTEALASHIAYLSESEDVPFSVLEQLLRHLHSMAKSQPEDVGFAIREHLRRTATERPLNLSVGDLVILTSVSTIFPTSDQWHSVVTPAMLTITRYLGQSAVQNLHDLGTGAYCCSLAMRYQSLSLRYVPEVITYVGKAIALLVPKPLPMQTSKSGPLNIPIFTPETSLRISESSTTFSKKLSFADLRSGESGSSLMPASLLYCFLNLTKQCVSLWSQKSSFPELISPVKVMISHLTSSPSMEKVSKEIRVLANDCLALISSAVSTLAASRKPLFLHNHKPLAIKSSYPAFIENYNPDRHYDPDRERAELAKLKAEHKKERKGAMRELRKDANFIAREQLREKKAKDEAYDKKFRRLVAEIQGEEGREAKEYEREKAKRKAKR